MRTILTLRTNFNEISVFLPDKERNILNLRSRLENKKYIFHVKSNYSKNDVTGGTSTGASMSTAHIYAIVTSSSDKIKVFIRERCLFVHMVCLGLIFQLLPTTVLVTSQCSHSLSMGLDTNTCNMVPI